MKTLLLSVCVAAAAAAPAPAASAPTYDEVLAVVARAEAGDHAARKGGIALLRENPSAPLAGAALGRLLVLQSQRLPIQVLGYLDLQRGFIVLTQYINAHPQEPWPRLWRGASALETGYSFWSAERARADLETALPALQAEPAAQADVPRCLLLLGIVSKDVGDLDAAFMYWRQAAAADPDGPAGAEAAKLIMLFTGS